MAPFVPCDDLAEAPCAQMGALAFGLLGGLGAGGSEAAAYALGLSWSWWPPLVWWSAALLLGWRLGKRARADIFSGSDPRRGARVVGLAGALLALLLTLDPLRAVVWGVFALLAAVWTSRAVLRMAMTC